MKKNIAIMLSLACVLLCGCTNSASYSSDDNTEYWAGYEDGYNNGLMEGYYSSEGYSEDDVIYMFYNIEQSAELYAASRGGWHPEEACCIIEDYLNNEKTFFENRVPTVDEFVEAVNSVTYFYAYYYSDMYEDVIDDWE